MSSKKTADAIYRSRDQLTQKQMTKIRGRQELDEANDNRKNLKPDDMAEQYPTDGYNVSHPKDFKFKYLENNNDIDTPFGRVQYDKDVETWLKQKRDAALKRAFEQWFAETYDKMGPAHKKLAREMFPNFYRERLRSIKNDTKMLGRIAQIRLEGPKSLKDLYLLYNLDQGIFDTRSLKNILHPEENAYSRNEEFKRGLFNPRIATGPATWDNDSNAQFFHNRQPRYKMQDVMSAPMNFYADQGYTNKDLF